MTKKGKIKKYAFIENHMRVVENEAFISNLLQLQNHSLAFILEQINHFFQLPVFSLHNRNPWLTTLWLPGTR